MSEVPDLEFPWPDCSVCTADGGNMDYDGDQWSCEDCGNGWAGNGTDGRSRWTA